MSHFVEFVVHIAASLCEGVTSIRRLVGIVLGALAVICLGGILSIILGFAGSAEGNALSYIALGLISVCLVGASIFCLVTAGD